MSRYSQAASEETQGFVLLLTKSESVSLYGQGPRWETQGNPDCGESFVFRWYVQLHIAPLLLWTILNMQISTNRKFCHAGISMKWMNFHTSKCADWSQFTRSKRVKMYTCRKELDLILVSPNRIHETLQKKKIQKKKISMFNLYQKKTFLWFAFLVLYIYKLS